MTDTANLATAEQNPFIDYFKARWSGASVDDAMAAAGATKVETDPAMEDEDELAYREEFEHLRDIWISKVIRHELEAAVMDALLESAKPRTKNLGIETQIAAAVRERMDAVANQIEEPDEEARELGINLIAMRLLDVCGADAVREYHATEQTRSSYQTAMLKALKRTREEYS